MTQANRPCSWTLAAAAYAFTDHSGWFFNFEHSREQERGLDYTEDLFCPGRWDGSLVVGQTMTLTATVETDLPDAARCGSSVRNVSRQSESAGTGAVSTAESRLPRGKP